jgi:tripeptidyl-peptidase-1
MVLIKLAVVALVALASAAPAPGKRVVHEKREKPASDWLRGSRIEGSAILPIRIGLAQSNLHKGHEFLSMFPS